MQFTVKLEEADEGGYTVQCLELPAAISEGDTKEEALENIKEAIQLVLIETIEILNDEKLMKGIKSSRKDLEAGRIHELKNIDELNEVWV